MSSEVSKTWEVCVGMWLVEEQETKTAGLHLTKLELQVRNLTSADDLSSLVESTEKPAL